MRRALVVLLACAALSATLTADVRTDERTQVKFEGPLGRMMNLFGGRGARDGVVSTVAVKGDRKMTLTDSTGQLIDLKEEKVYDLDVRNKTYTVMTFAELRKRIEDARQKAASQAPPDAGRPQGGDATQAEVDFSVKETGQKRSINGYDTREIVMTIGVREKGKPIEESGGFVLTANSWLAPRIPAMADVATFDRRYAEKLGLGFAANAEQMATAMAMYPMIRDAMSRFERENANVDGTAVLTVLTYEAVSNQVKGDAAAPTARQEPAPTGVGGLGGRLGRRILGGGGKQDTPAPATASGNRATVMTSQHELLKVSPTVSDADVAIPSGFKQKS